MVLFSNLPSFNFPIHKREANGIILFCEGLGIDFTGWQRKSSLYSAGYIVNPQETSLEPGSFREVSWNAHPRWHLSNNSGAHGLMSSSMGRRRGIKEDLRTCLRRQPLRGGTPPGGGPRRLPSTALPASHCCLCPSTFPVSSCLPQLRRLIHVSPPSSRRGAIFRI